MLKFVAALASSFLFIASSSFANSEVFYDCSLVLQTKNLDGSWALDASPSKKVGPIPTRGTLRDEITFKEFSGEIELYSGFAGQAGRVALRAHKSDQKIPSGTAYATVLSKNIEAGLELNEEQIVGMRCTQN